jgi:hypothetical protein
MKLRMELLLALLLLVASGIPGCGTEVGNGNKEVSAKDSDEKNKASEDNDLSNDGALETDDEITSSPDAGKLESEEPVSVEQPNLALMFTECAELLKHIDTPVGLAVTYNTGDKTTLVIDTSVGSVAEIQSAGIQSNVSSGIDGITVTQAGQEPQTHKNICQAPVEDSPYNGSDYEANHQFLVKLIPEGDTVEFTLTYYVNKIGSAAKGQLVGLEITMEGETTLTMKTPESTE